MRRGANPTPERWQWVPVNTPKVNLLKKWTSICRGMHFLSNDLKVYYNGKHVNQELEEKRKKNKKQTLDSLLPEEYFKGKLSQP